MKWVYYVVEFWKVVWGMLLLCWFDVDYMFGCVYVIWCG